jgi:hypothetical protein
MHFAIKERSEYPGSKVFQISNPDVIFNQIPADFALVTRAKFVLQ